MPKLLLALACLAACAAPASAGLPISAADRAARKERLDKLEKEAEAELKVSLPGKSDDEMARTISDREARLNDSLNAAAGGDEMKADIYAFMALFQKLAQQMRNSAREMRQSEMRVKASQLEDAAAKTRDAADKRFKESVAAASAQVSAGAAGVTTAGVTAKSSLSDRAAALKKEGADLEVKLRKTASLTGEERLKALDGLRAKAAAEEKALETLSRDAARDKAQDIAKWTRDEVSKLRDRIAQVQREASRALKP